MVTEAAARAAVAAVADPELPVVTIDDLGILRTVSVEADRVRVAITPTYSGCPAMDVIRSDIRSRLAEIGVSDVEVETQLAPPWTTDAISPAGRAKLDAAGIAPPGPRGQAPVAVRLSVRCPHCASPDTEELSRYSSTACKALWRCRACGEPFDRIKEH
ncbi:1,2-phenylacetyl-CoA epoxidase subunit PaaD [Actinocatenispora sera]|uniref:Phenylacetate-CoA oxygenase subunit PaaJ n=1 Tax=Actinocatenispora sera TaxID=390989 RepID=A0A810KXM5_9ACTN|nr:1,2-phenylacetyl-CoA epoxidase subunit PaaD [Actinocatenispora sera]BCJ27844.1 phenylacetate-CoA oxygenase subunit PaaJ [Actinocatenispora sera]